MKKIYYLILVAALLLECCTYKLVWGKPQSPELQQAKCPKRI